MKFGPLTEMGQRGLRASTWPSRSTNTPMKTIGFLIIASTLVATQLSAAALEDGFIRKPRQYSLDEKGSTLTITKRPVGSWSLKVTWSSGDVASSATPDDCLRSDGWFVFVEQPNRIWIFDGVDGGTVLSRSEKGLRDSSFSTEILASCPKEVWGALPEKVRSKYRQLELDKAANGRLPLPSRTSESAQAAGSCR
jgi:hypothetical protein